MFEATGENVPLLFGKWKPDKFRAITTPDEEVVDGERQLHYYYFFPEGYVDFHLDGLQCIIQGEFPVHGLNLKKRYPKHLRDMYLDGKSYVADLISTLSTVNREFRSASVDKISWFGRIVHIMLEFDHRKAGIPLENVDTRVHAIKEIYEDIERQLREDHCFGDETLRPGYVMGYSIGEEKVLYSPKGIIVVASKYSEEIIGAGMLYMKIAGNENAELSDHKSALETVLKTISRHKELLVSYHGRPFCHELKENGTLWQIDFRQISFYEKLDDKIRRNLIPHKI